MLKRLAVLGVAGIFLAVPPAVAESSSTVKAPAAKTIDGSFGSARHGDGQCPFKADSAAL
jgi:hypothetical protein